MVRRAWWSATAEDFVAAAPAAVLGTLADRSPFAVEQLQTEAWKFEIRHLLEIAPQIPDAHFFLEFSIPRVGRRADAIIIANGIIFVLEYKVGAEAFSRNALEQVHGYALDLKNFHASSHDKRIVPILIATNAPPQNVELGLFAADAVAAPYALAPTDLAPAILQIIRAVGSVGFDAEAWAAGSYQPTPTIIEAAAALYRGHSVDEISRSEAGAENLTRTAAAIGAVIRAARANQRKAVIFVTGVPGAGKTLAGLNIACSRLDGAAQEDATFLSGNGPLVKVLRAALAEDAKLRGSWMAGAAGRDITARSPKKFIQNLHDFRDEYLFSDSGAPSEHVVVFDEAQRAWNREETARFVRRRHGITGFNQSEPEFLLSVMGRHSDWCVVVCLIGEGQEINRGEAGVSAWIAAVADPAFAYWEVHAPPHLSGSGPGLSRAERWLLQQRAAPLDAALHLAVSVRSFRAEELSAWVAALLGEDAAMARQLLPAAERYPIWRTRSLVRARSWLRAQRRASERAGVLASSNAIRLKPEGIYVKSPIEVEDWFLKDSADIRSSNALEDVATEFDVQGLEVDWAAVAWDLNWRREHDAWVAWQFRGNKWTLVRREAQQRYVRNSYRVLLTRARQGMVLFVPAGDAVDPTRLPEAYDAIDAWLARAGVPSLDECLGVCQ